jgi:hypothetical protein
VVELAFLEDDRVAFVVSWLFQRKMDVVVVNTTEEQTQCTNLPNLNVQAAATGAYVRPNHQTLIILLSETHSSSPRECMAQCSRQAPYQVRGPGNTKRERTPEEKARKALPGCFPNLTGVPGNPKRLINEFQLLVHVERRRHYL